MVDYKLAVYNACRDNNLNGLMVSVKKKFLELFSVHFDNDVRQFVL